MIRLGLIFSLFGSLFILTACDDDNIPGVPDVSIPSTSTSYKPKPIEWKFDIDLPDWGNLVGTHGYRINELLTLGEDVEDQSKIRQHKLKILEAEKDPQFQAIKNRVEAIGKKAQTLEKLEDAVAHARKFHEQKWPEQSDKAHGEFALKMSKQSLNYYLTFVEAFLFFESVEPGLTSDEYKEMANKIADSMTDKEAVRSILESPEGVVPFTRFTRLAAFEQVFYYSVEQRKSTEETGLGIAETFMNARGDDDILFLTWLRFLDLIKNKYGDLIIAGNSHVQMAAEGLSYYVMFRDATEFAELKRGSQADNKINEHTNKFQFAKDMADRDPSFFRFYKTSYEFALEDPALMVELATDDLRHEYAMKKAAEDLEKHNQDKEKK